MSTDIDNGNGDSGGDRDDDDLGGRLARLEALLGDADSIDQTPDSALETVVRESRPIAARLPPGDPLRVRALSILGLAQVQRVSRRIGHGWANGLQALFAQARPQGFARGINPSGGTEQAEALDEAIEALETALGSTAHSSPDFPRLAASLGIARVLRSASRLPGPSGEDLPEAERVFRIVVDHPASTLSDRRRCADYIMYALLQSLLTSGIDLSSLRPGGRPGLPEAKKASPAREADIDILIGTLMRLVAAGAADDDPELPTALAILVAMRGGVGLSDAELASWFALRERAAAQFADTPPLVRAIVLSTFAVVGTEWVRRGTCPEETAAEIESMFRQALRALPLFNPITWMIALHFAAFQAARARAKAAPRPAIGESGAAGAETPAAIAAASTTDAQASGASVPGPSALSLPLEPFDLRVGALFGVGSEARLAVPPGRAAEVIEPLLNEAAGDSADDDELRSAATCVAALASHSRWLHERDFTALNRAVEFARSAIEFARPAGSLRSRLTELSASMLLDRFQIGGSRADLDAALAGWDALLAGAYGVGWIPDLNALLMQIFEANGFPRAATLLAPPHAEAGSASIYLAELEAGRGAALLARAESNPGGDSDVAEAIDALRRAVAGLPEGHPRRLEARSDLALARLIRDAARSNDDPALRGEIADAVSEMVDVAAHCPADHPRRTVLLLRAAAAVSNPGAGGGESTSDGATDVGPVDRCIAMLDDALATAGTASPEERSRCLYGLGHALLGRFVRTRGERPADLERAVHVLNEARASLDSLPGDPLAIPLLRTLATASRMAALQQPGSRFARTRSLDIARSVMHEHGRAVMLQDGTRRGLAAARPAARDMLRLLEWCSQDGELARAVESVELGRGLVLHQAVTTADVHTLLTEAGRPDLAGEWRSGGHRQRPGAAPADLRRRVLSVLGEGPAERRLLSAPDVPQIAAALRDLDMDVLIYLIPGSIPDPDRSDRDDNPNTSADGLAAKGRALAVSADGEVWECALPDLTAEPGGIVSRYAEAQRDTAASRDLPGAQDGTADAGQRTDRRGRLLGELCAWAWFAAIGPLLDRLGPGGRAAPGTTADVPDPEAPRIVLVPLGPLGLVPWQAARRSADGDGDGTAGPPRYACQSAVFSTSASARQLIDAARRAPQSRHQPGPAVFVANPTGDLPWAAVEAESICEVFYPDAVLLGTADAASAVIPSGSGTSEEVLSWLPSAAADSDSGGGEDGDGDGDGDGGQDHDRRRGGGAALLHFGCHGRAERAAEQSCLSLADGDLSIDRVLAQAAGRSPADPAGLVILAACTSDLAAADYDEALTLASAFLAAGAGGVVGSRWRVPDFHTALLMFMFHRELALDPKIRPVDALRAAQLWMLDPGRRIPPEMPTRLARHASFFAHDVDDIYNWAAFAHHGC